MRSLQSIIYHGTFQKLSGNTTFLKILYKIARGGDISNYFHSPTTLTRQYQVVSRNADKVISKQFIPQAVKDRRGIRESLGKQPQFLLHTENLEFRTTNNRSQATKLAYDVPYCHMFLSYKQKASKCTLLPINV